MIAPAAEKITNRHIAKLMCDIEVGDIVKPGSNLHKVVSKHIRREMHWLKEDILSLLSRPDFD